MKENGEGVGEVRRSFDHDASLTTGEEEGKEKGSGQINLGLQCSSTKVQPGQWGVLKPKCLSAPLPCSVIGWEQPLDCGIGITWQ